MNFKVEFKDSSEPNGKATLPITRPGQFVECPIDQLQPHEAAKVSLSLVNKFCYETASKGGDLYVVATPDGIIVDGVIRWHAAKIMKWKTIKVMVVAPPSLNFDQSRAYQRTKKR